MVKVTLIKWTGFVITSIVILESLGRITLKFLFVNYGFDIS